MKRLILLFIITTLMGCGSATSVNNNNSIVGNWEAEEMLIKWTFTDEGTGTLTADEFTYYENENLLFIKFKSYDEVHVNHFVVHGDLLTLSSANIYHNAPVSFSIFTVDTSAEIISEENTRKFEEYKIIGDTLQLRTIANGKQILVNGIIKSDDKVDWIEVDSLLTAQYYDKYYILYSKDNYTTLDDNLYLWSDEKQSINYIRK